MWSQAQTHPPIALSFPNRAPRHLRNCEGQSCRRRHQLTQVIASTKVPVNHPLGPPRLQGHSNRVAPSANEDTLGGNSIDGRASNQIRRGTSDEYLWKIKCDAPASATFHWICERNLQVHLGRELGRLFKRRGEGRYSESIAEDSIRLIAIHFHLDGRSHSASRWKPSAP